MNELKRFLALRDEMIETPIGDGGADVCTALSDALDTALRQLAGDLSDKPVAVLAVGGYGRREQCIFSDVDLAIVHEGADLDALARQILYPLWDSNLKVGHSIRTIRESTIAGKDRLETLTSQLSARLVAGSEELFADFTDGLAKTLAATPIRSELASLEIERRRVDPYQVMAADVKNGRGALRTFQSLWWERRRSTLLGQDAGTEAAAEEEAKTTLLAVRNGLHAASGRQLDRYAFDARERVAEWLGSDVVAVGGRLCRALAQGDRLAEQQWPEILGERRPRRSSRFLSSLRQSRERHDVGVLQSSLHFFDRPERIREAAQNTAGVRTPWPETERDAFVKLVGSGQSGRMAFVQLQEAGWIEREFPEWLPVIALPQMAPFHEHPADAHLWRTADEMVSLLEDADPFKEEMIAELGADDELLLSAFLHDIGKGRGGDHSELGAQAAEQFLSRVGYGETATGTIAEAIRNHLLLIRTATRRDIATAEVIDVVANRVGDPRLLQMLYLLTIADNKATGTTMWSEWKETLLTQLYMRVAERLGGSSGPTPTPATEIADLSDVKHTEADIQEHLDAMPDDYAEVVTSADVAWHLDCLDGFEDHTALSVDRNGRRVLAIGRDRRGFLLAVCRAFAAHGVGIRDARVYTRSDGIAIDTFEVEHDRTGGLVPNETWPQVASTLEEIEASGLDVTRRVAHRAAAYAEKPQSEVMVAVRPDLSSRHLALEIRSPDHIGLLADIVEALYREGLDLQLARIDTRGNEAIDVLYVGADSAPTEQAELEAMCERIADSIRSDA